MGGARETPDSAAAQRDTASAEAALKAGNGRGSHEQAVITQHRADATAQATAEVTGMQSSKGAALAAYGIRRMQQRPQGCLRGLHLVRHITTARVLAVRECPVGTPPCT